MTKKKSPPAQYTKCQRIYERALVSTPQARQVWEDITPLARNEWICWVTSGKKDETRKIRIEKALSKLKSGMHRPCCWVGCPHRRKNATDESRRTLLPPNP